MIIFADCFLPIETCSIHPDILEWQQQINPANPPYPRVLNWYLIVVDHAWFEIHLNSARIWSS